VRKIAGIHLVFVAVLACTSCGGGGSGSPPLPQARYTIGGTVAGLQGRDVVLALNGGDTVTVSTNGGFTFASPLPAGAGYAVTISRQPASPSQECTVAQASGTANAPVTSVLITCTGQAIGGTVSGLLGTGLELILNGGSNVTVATNTTYQFPVTLLPGDQYEIAVAAAPDAPVQQCVVEAPVGTVVGNVTADVRCAVVRERSVFTFAAIYTGAYLRAGLVTGFAAGAEGSPLRPVSTLTQSRYLDAYPLVNINGASYVYGRANMSAGVDPFPIGLAGLRVAADGLSMSEVPGSPFILAGSGNPIQVQGIESYAMHPSKRLLYASSDKLPGVSAFLIDQQTGALTVTPASPLLLPDYLTGFAVTANGKFAVASFSLVFQSRGELRTYSIDSATGALTLSAALPFTHQLSDAVLALAPDGRHAYVTTNAMTMTVSIDPRTGALSRVAGGDLGTRLDRFAASQPGGNLLFFRARYGRALTGAYLRDAQTGVLTSVLSTPDAVDVVFDVTGKYVYLLLRSLNGVPGAIEGYTIGNSGNLTPIAGANAALDESASRIVVDPSGQKLRVLTANSIQEFGIDRGTGALTRPPRHKVAQKNTFGLLSLAGAELPVFSSRHSYVLGDGQLSTLEVDEDVGSLESASPSALSIAPDARSLTLDAEGRFLYSISPMDQTITGFSRDPASGQVATIAGPAAVPAVPSGFALEPLGRFGYASSAAASSIYTYSRNGAGGLAATGTPFATSNPLGKLIANPLARVLYGLSASAGSVLSLPITEDTGRLTEADAAPSMGTEPRDLVLDPTGRWLYVLNHGSADIAALRVGVAGRVSFSGSHIGSVATGDDPRALACDPRGRFVYAANYGSGDVSVYSIDDATGALSEIAGSPFPVGGGPVALTTTSGGGYLEVSLSASATVASFALDEITGALSTLPVSTVQTTSMPSEQVMTSHAQ
jgi:6-phosphogluconolactonase (cycloisomerase 2 family)